jgi:hypothetical protein
MVFALRGGVYEETRLRGVLGVMVIGSCKGKVSSRRFVGGNAAVVA